LESILLVAFERKRLMTRNIRSRKSPDWTQKPGTLKFRHSFASRMGKTPSGASGTEDTLALRLVGTYLPLRSAWMG